MTTTVEQASPEALEHFKQVFQRKVDERTAALAHPAGLLDHVECIDAKTGEHFVFTLNDPDAGLVLAARGARRLDRQPALARAQGEADRDHLARGRLRALEAPDDAGHADARHLDQRGRGDQGRQPDLRHVQLAAGAPALRRRDPQADSRREAVDADRVHLPRRTDLLGRRTPLDAPGGPRRDGHARAARRVRPSRVRPRVLEGDLADGRQRRAVADRLDRQRRLQPADRRGQLLPPPVGQRRDVRDRDAVPRAGISTPIATRTGTRRTPALSRRTTVPSSSRARREDAFIHTGECWFDVESLGCYEERPLEPLFRCRFFPDASGVRAKIHKKEKGWIRVYERPDPNKEYAIGADVATGRGLDYSCAYVDRPDADEARRGVPREDRRRRVRRAAALPRALVRQRSPRDRDGRRLRRAGDHLAPRRAQGPTALPEALPAHDRGPPRRAHARELRVPDQHRRRARS